MMANQLIWHSLVVSLYYFQISDQLLEPLLFQQIHLPELPQLQHMEIPIIKLKLLSSRIKCLNKQKLERMQLNKLESNV